MDKTCILMGDIKPETGNYKCAAWWGRFRSI